MCAREHMRTRCVHGRGVLAGCGHCKNLAPTYEELGGVYEKSKDVVIAKVDADAHRDLGGRFGVQGFPTIKFFPRGSTTPEEYVRPTLVSTARCHCRR